MVESNFQRSQILPSEKAFAYKMRLEAMNRQGQRTDLTSTPVVSKSRTNEQLGAEVGESREQIRRYIRLTELVPELLEYVDEGRIKMRKFHDEGKLTTEVISSIMSEEKPNQREKIVLRGDRVRQLIPKNVPLSQTEEFVCKALEHYNRFLRNRDRDSR